MALKPTPLIATLLAATLLAGCGSSASTDSDGGSKTTSIDVVGFSVLEAANEKVFEAFKATDAGKNVEFATAYGASGDQSRAVEAGLDADEVHFSLEPDVTRLVDAGLVDQGWKDGENKGVLTQSIVVFVVRKGNPKGIKSWADLVKPGVKVVTPNPGSSGSAKWNLLAAYGAAKATDGEAGAKKYAKDLIDHVAALPGSARDASTAFSGGTGDVLLSYENEAILARQKGADFDYVVPEETLLIQNAGAVTKDADKAAQDFYDFQISEEGQKQYAAEGFRPLQSGLVVEVQGANDPKNPFPAPKKLLTVDSDFGGWSEANKTFFDEKAGLFTTLIAAAGKA